MMPSPLRFRVDAYHAGRQLASRTQVMDVLEGRRVAFDQLRAGAVLVEIIAVDTTGPFVVATYQPARQIDILHCHPGEANHE